MTRDLYVGRGRVQDPGMARSGLSLALSVLVSVSAPAALSGCIDAFPDKIVLRPEAANVEIVTDPPNPEVYEPTGEVATQVIGREVGEAFRQAFNELRNQAATKGATFVHVEEVSSRAAWDFSGRVVVSIVGTAYRGK
jgi:hypothetical protein